MLQTYEANMYCEKRNNRFKKRKQVSFLEFYI